MQTWNADKFQIELFKLNLAHRAAVLYFSLFHSRVELRALSVGIVYKLIAVNSNIFHTILTGMELYIGDRMQ